MNLVPSGTEIDNSLKEKNGYCLCSNGIYTATKGMPTAIIAKSVKGKGVSFMENQAGWHGNAPSDEHLSIALEELGGALHE